jgi:hypothetical protein
MLIRVVILVLLCLAVFGPIASADTVAATPVDAAEDGQLQELDAQTSQDVEDIQGGLSKAWGIVGVVLVVIIVLSVVL